MHKVMLVDDDIPVLDYLEKMLPWEELGLQLLGGYDESEEALVAALEQMPDLLITDIGMPGIDGLELVKRLKEKSPMLQVLIISCHNEFNYAQQALKLNVHEYILKETLSVESIAPILEKMVQEIEHEKAVISQTERLKKFESEHRSVIKEKLLHNMLHTPLWNYEDWLRYCVQQGVSIPQGAIIPVLCRVDRYADTIAGLRLSDETYSFAFDNIVSEGLGSSGMYLPLDSKLGVILFSADASLNINAFETVRDQVKVIQSELMKYLKTSSSYYIGQRTVGAELRRAVASMLARKDTPFYDRDMTIAVYREVAFSIEDLFAHYAEAEQELKRELVSGSKDELKEILSRWFGLIMEKHYQPSAVKEWVLKLMLDLLIKLRTLNHYSSTYSEEVIHQKILNVDSIYQLQDWLLAYIEQISLPQSDQLMFNSLIVKAQNYVAKHLNEKISTEEVAKHLHLNPNYFSRMYKQGTGEGFIRYVTRIKMEEACRLLDTTTKSIEEIADQLGYENKSYFNKCFKAILNVPPVEYRGQK